MQELEYIAYMTNDICNLNCKSCNNCAPIADHNNPFYADFNKFKKNIQIIKNVCHTKFFEIMGGEPLLNPNIMDFINYASDVYKDTNTKVVLYTNGILMMKFLTKENIKILQKKNVSIFFSEYPINLNYDNIFRALKILKIDFCVQANWRTDERIDDEGDWINIKLSERKNKISKCYVYENLTDLMIKDDYLYGCSCPLNIKTLNKSFGTKFKLDKSDYEYIPELTKDKMKRFCSSIKNGKMNICKHCYGTEIYSNWDKSKKDMSEWIEK